MPYRVDKTKIAKGALRFGTVVTIGGNTSYKWRHWGCVTVAQFANFAKEELTAEALDGYEEMLPEDQARIARAFEEGHVADEDIPDTARKPLDADGNPIPSPKKASPKKKAAPKKKKADSDDDDEDEDAPPKKKPVKAVAKGKAGAKKKAPAKKGKKSKKDSESEGSFDGSESEDEKPKKGAKGRKAKDASESESEGVFTNEGSESEDEQPARKKAKKGKQDSDDE